MTKWVNSDGLIVKFGADEGHQVLGGHLQPFNDLHSMEIKIPYTEMASATYAIIGSVGSTTKGALGVVLPEGARIHSLSVFVETAFTSSGTIGSSVFSLGLKKMSDQSTELDHDGLLTTSFVGSALDAAGEFTEVKVGSTGAGALIGTTLAEDGVLVGANTAHATHPFTAGVAVVKVYYYFVT
jgi:hypothetical protein